MKKSVVGYRLVPYLQNMHIFDWKKNECLFSFPLRISRIRRHDNYKQFWEGGNSNQTEGSGRLWDGMDGWMDGGSHHHLHTNNYCTAEYVHSLAAAASFFEHRHHRKLSGQSLFGSIFISSWIKKRFYEDWMDELDWVEWVVDGRMEGKGFQFEFVSERERLLTAPFRASSSSSRSWWTLELMFAQYVNKNQHTHRESLYRLFNRRSSFHANVVFFLLPFYIQPVSLSTQWTLESLWCPVVGRLDSLFCCRLCLPTKIRAYCSRYESRHTHKPTIDYRPFRAAGRIPMPTTMTTSGGLRNWKFNLKSFEKSRTQKMFSYQRRKV